MTIDTDWWKSICDGNAKGAPCVHVGDTGWLERTHTGRLRLAMCDGGDEQSETLHHIKTHADVCSLVKSLTGRDITN